MRSSTGSAPDHGEADPDPRFTLANERTFLAWSRTALALIAGGLAVSQLVKNTAKGLTLAVALLLIVFGALLVIIGYRQWMKNQTALRRGQPVEPSSLPIFLAQGIAAFAVAAAVLAAIRFAS